MIKACLDLDNRTVHFRRNNKDLGIAFSNLDASRLYFPAVSLGRRKQCVLNLGKRASYCHYSWPQSNINPDIDFMPLLPQPAPVLTAEVHAQCSCLCKLAV